METLSTLSMRDLYLWFYFVLFASNCKGRNGYQPRLPILRKQCNSNISSCCHRVKYRTFACETNITDIHVTYGSLSTCNTFGFNFTNSHLKCFKCFVIFVQVVQCLSVFTGIEFLCFSSEESTYYLCSVIEQLFL